MSVTTRSGRYADAPAGLLMELAADDDDGQRDDGSDESVEEVRDSNGAVMVAVEGPDVYHTSWAAWLSYFTGYCERTLQVLPVKQTMLPAE
ncbi:hypothetical protein PHMEG_0007793 [Phytophthora megakarya]|uniref:Uncharacterized protein n=1 Tax=Phytophthora megakarya TaxID=4795 RepID=A0A225WKJ7_9STRA|nr:hypothetical protein PHMEG_0007793 [Phytophthora megakarya]